MELLERVFFLFFQKNKDGEVRLGTLGDALTPSRPYVVRMSVMDTRSNNMIRTRIGEESVTSDASTKYTQFLECCNLCGLAGYIYSPAVPIDPTDGTIFPLLAF